MATCADNINPLVRSGTNRLERMLPALDPNYALPDTQSFEHWMVYARDLAGHIKYFNSTNQNVNNEKWQPFFDADVSAQLALIAVQNVNAYKEKIRALFDSIRSEDLKNDAVQLHKNFAMLFNAALSLAYRIDHFQTVLPDDVMLKRSSSNLIYSKLAPALRRLLGYYKAADTFYSPKLILETTDPDWTILAYKQEKASDIIAKGLSDKWFFKLNDTEVIVDWNDYYNNKIGIDSTIFNHPTAVVADADVWKVLNHVVNHNLFANIFAEFLSGYARIVRDAQQQLLKTITQQNNHQPHYALYLTFLHLFKHAQAGLNTYTERHLDLYYKEILQLKPKNAEPNHVHLFLELANMTSAHLVKKGTPFNAGKDSLKKDVIYTSDEDVLINKASVAQLRSFYRAAASDSPFIGNLYASPIANSGDGAGAKLTTAEGDWQPFANKIFTDGDLTLRQMPLANIGFALASNYLFLKEGKRTITITFKGTSLSKLNGKQFDCFITTEKNWLHKTLSITASATQATFTVNLAPTDVPVTTFVPKVHLDVFQGIDTPVIKFFLKNIAGTDQYSDLKDVEIASIDLKVNVGSLSGQFNTDGVKELLVATDQGTVDPSKPFLPFGQNPKKGTGLIIGNKEVFSKANTKFKLFIEWAELIDSIKDMDVNLTNEFFPSAQFKFLQSGVWVDGDFTSILNKENQGHDKGEVELFWGANSIMMAQTYVPSAAHVIPTDALVDYKKDYSTFNISSQQGFIRLQLNADFQWDEYYMDLQKYLIGLAIKAPDNSEPKKPYLPKIQSIYLSYESSCSINFSSTDNTAKFIHLYPFGFDEIDSSNIIAGKAALMPQFTHVEDDVVQHDQAEFLIGLQNALPSQKVNILFKVLDGSTDPLQSKPDKHVSWSYLSNNIWKDFDRTEINDTTQQLIETGIISFSLPEDASNNNTLLPAGYHWIRASIKELPEQVCRLINVRAQVLQATFTDQQNAPDFLQKALVANTISKLKEPDAEIKKVEQPYSSFGGRYTEDAQSFYTRVSERLRHKNRAITIRDVEELVLEEFPDIHKVKCLNHTRLEMDVTPVLYNELAPGHVTVVTIPDLKNKNAIDPLRPYTNRSRLTAIKTYLQARANCNVKWHVENPRFEEIRVKTEVILTDMAAGNAAFYEKQLKDDLVKYLTPWAYSVNTDIRFGGKIAKSSIINFIEELAYINVILKLEMFHNNMDGTPESGDKDEILASTARSILVSAAASKHQVTITKKPVKSDSDECE
jgi:hypothetical protein